MATPIIAFDVDGVLLDLNTEWLRRYNAEFGDKLTVDDLTQWSMSSFVKPEAQDK